MGGREGRGRGCKGEGCRGQGGGGRGEAEGWGEELPVSASGIRLSAETRQTGKRQKEKMPGLQLYMEAFLK